MPVLTNTAKTKRVVLSASSKPDDEAWVDVVEGIKMGTVLDLDLSTDRGALTIQMLSRIITNWNFTEEDRKTILPITEENLRLLDVEDIIQITEESGLNAKFESLSTQKKRE